MKWAKVLLESGNGVCHASGEGILGTVLHNIADLVEYCLGYSPVRGKERQKLGTWTVHVVTSWYPLRFLRTGYFYTIRFNGPPVERIAFGVKLRDSESTVRAKPIEKSTSQATR